MYALSTPKEITSKGQEVGNQTRKRRGVEMGGWVLWPPGWKKGVHPPPLPKRGNRPFPHMGRPTDKASSASRPPWRGPQYGSGDYPTTRPGGGVGIGPTPEKSASHWSNGFLLTSCYRPLISETPTDLNWRRDISFHSLLTQNGGSFAAAF